MRVARPTLRRTRVARVGRAYPHAGGRAVANYKEAYIGIDAAKVRNAVAVADGGRNGEIRYLGEFDASPENVRRLMAKLATKYDRLYVCYEAGPTGYGLYRQI